MRFGTNAMAYLSEEISSDVSEFIVLIDGNPPRGQLRACSMLNFVPHTHWEGRHVGCQP